MWEPTQLPTDNTVQLYAIIFEKITNIVMSHDLTITKKLCHAWCSQYEGNTIILLADNRDWIIKFAYRNWGDLTCNV